MTYIYILGAIIICFIGGYLRGRNAEQRDIGFRVAELQQKYIHALKEKCQAERELQRIQKAIKDKGGTEYYPTEDAYLWACKALENQHETAEFYRNEAIALRAERDALAKQLTMPIKKVEVD